MSKSSYIERTSPKAAKKIGEHNGDPNSIREAAFSDRQIVRRQIVCAVNPTDGARDIGLP